MIAITPEVHGLKYGCSAMGGNLCRCGTYFRIRTAIKQVAAGK